MIAMKKIYSVPEIEIVVVNAAQPLMTGSITGGSILEEPAGTDVPGLAPGMTLPGMGLPGFEGF